MEESQANNRSVSLTRLLPFLLVGATLLVYSNSLTGPFILDDSRLIADNPRIRQLWPLTEPLGNTSRPIVQLSLALNYALGGLNVAGYHVVNILLHATCALILFGISRRVLKTDQIAFAIALLWALHPLATQPVNYVIQRGELLMALFLLLTLYALCRGWLVMAVTACALGMASKPVMAVAPLVALLFDRAYLAGSFQNAWRQRKWFYVSLALTELVLPLVLLNGRQEWLGTAGLGVQRATPWQYALTQPAIILHYLRLAVWPDRLCFDYMWTPAKSLAEVWLPVCIVTALLALTVWACVKKPAVGFLGAAFFLTLAPTSSFVPIDDLAVEHRMYLPLAAVVALAVMTLRRLKLPGLVVVALGFGILTYRRNLVYQSDVSIWTDTIAKAPSNFRAHNNLAEALNRQGAVAEAVAHAEDAARLEPRSATPQYNLANALDDAGRTRDAIRHYELALRLNPHYAKAHHNLGVVLIREGRYDEAIRHFDAALRLQPDLAEAAYYWGVALVKLGQTEAALEKFTLSLQTKPNFDEGYIGRGMVLLELGRPAEAIADFETALKLRPDSAKAHRQLALALQRLGRESEAEVHLQEAGRLSPSR